MPRVWEGPAVPGGARAADDATAIIAVATGQFIQAGVADQAQDARGKRSYMFTSASARRAAPARRASARHAVLARTIVLAAGIAATLAIPSVTAATAPYVNANFRGAGTATNSWLVTFRSGVNDFSAMSALSSTGATDVGDLADINTRVLSLPAGREQQTLAALARDPRVASIERDATDQAAVVPTDPQWQHAWGPKLVRAPQAWNMSTGKPSTIIAIVDTGVDRNQPDLRGRVLKGWDFVNNDNNPRDDNGHGTAVAGVAAAAANNGVGIAGLCWHCDILPVKVLNAAGSGAHSNIAAGIIWATKHGADVINMSLAGPSPSNVVAAAVAYARNHGVVVVAAAGNEGSSRHFYPAADPGVISVGATDGADHMYNWSNRGAWVKLAAPGCAYTGSTGPIRWTWWCGTSFAAPIVAGIAALMKSLEPGLSRAAIERTLLSSTVNVRGVADGRIDAALALRKAWNLGTPSSTPSPTPKPTPSASSTSDPNTTYWRDALSGDTQSRTRTFHWSGAVHLQLQWTSGADVYLKVTNSSGDVLLSAHDSNGQIDSARNVHDGDYTVQVGEWSDTWTSFRVTIED